MSEDNLYHPSEKAKKVSLINEKHFSEKYDYSIDLNDQILVNNKPSFAFSSFYTPAMTNLTF